MHGDREFSQAEHLDGGTSVAGANVQAVEIGVIGRELDVEGLRLDVLGGHGHGGGQGGSNSSSLHCDELVVVVIRGVGRVVVGSIRRKRSFVCDDDDEKY